MFVQNKFKCNVDKYILVFEEQSHFTETFIDCYANIVSDKNLSSSPMKLISDFKSIRLFLTQSYVDDKKRSNMSKLFHGVLVNY